MEKRLFIPGSEWLYFKLYCGSKTADSILVNHILPLTELLLSKNIADKWFFIRYSDPEFHIRLRIHIPKAESYGDVFSLAYPVLKKLVENNSIYKVQCDSYNRELERYGAERYQHSETLFYIDSLYILKMLKTLRELPDSDMGRWRVALLLINDTLDGFGLIDTEKRDFMFSQSEGFKKEFGYVSIPFIRQLNDKYRENRKNIESVFFESGKGFLAEILILFTERREKIKDLNSLIYFTTSVDKKELYSYLASIIHMTMNRLFHSSNRMYEMVIYDFLYRQYKSCIARR